MKTLSRDIKIRRSQGAVEPFTQRRVGFTLVEMMVTLAIMMLLFGIIFVPLNQAFNFFHLGQTRTSMQQAARQTLEQISSDLRTAVRVFPNTITPGITNQAPYKHPLTGNSLPPYIEVANPVAADSCKTTGLRRANLSRIDFIPAELDNNGTVVTPVRPARYLVTYYARRYNTQDAYEPINNPVLLFRAQSPIRNGDNSLAKTPDNKINVDTSSERYGPNCDGDVDGDGNDDDGRGSAWLMQQNGEPNFERPWPAPTGAAITSDAPNGNVPGSHTRAIPLGVSLTAPQAALPASDPNRNYTPLTTFTLTDSNDDGKIDQVKINLALSSYDTSSTNNGSGTPPDSQKLRMSTTVDLPNVM
ncbi:MAG TPA: prepilin-type N-terminal cleavage/methylation domain-containing protein [Abditibacteriaceae bacterium]|jgi:hypothetical protein